MDPNETLRELRKLLNDVPEDITFPQIATRFGAVWAQFTALDEWLTKDKGFLPDDWQPNG